MKSINGVMTSQKSFSARPADIHPEWHVVDADGVVVGRLAALVATWLRGKHKPHYTPHIDCGDHVIIINAEKAVFTGRKRSDKQYHRHTGHPGGIKTTTPEKIFEGKHPERVVEKAIERMMPDGPLARQQLRKLRVYGGALHRHQAQQPKQIDVAGFNRKNTAARSAV